MLKLRFLDLGRRSSAVLAFDSVDAVDSSWRRSAQPSLELGRRHSEDLRDKVAEERLDPVLLRR